MLFNSLEFLFLFLPIILLVSFLLRGEGLIFWLALGSCVFYSYAGHPWFLIPMIFTATVDYLVGKGIGHEKRLQVRKRLLIFSIVVNLALLAYFKYVGLFAESGQAILTFLGLQNVDFLQHPILHVILPAGISFYTFQTISYVVDIYCNVGHPEDDYITYFCFVVFFPHLVAGPLTRHHQLIPQLKRIANAGIHPRWQAGLFLFFAGLTKKILIADRIANNINPVISNMHHAGAVDAWMVLMGYACQIYFDFSGYSDMAIGLGRLMEIELPQNFNSPYKAVSPKDFWKRWHMTLSLWLKDYLYIPLGGNRASKSRQRVNLLITMGLGGLWHGASWTFLAWGVYHGLLLVGFHTFETSWARLPKLIQTFSTMILVTMGWVFFRSSTLSDAWIWLQSLLFLRGFGLRELAMNPRGYISIVVALLVCYGFKNTNEIDWEKLSPSWSFAFAISAGLAVIMMNLSSRFLYFQF